jgi:hypothetical protein
MIIPLILGLDALAILHRKIEAASAKGEYGYECLWWPSIPLALLLLDIIFRRFLWEKVKVNIGSRQ